MSGTDAAPLSAHPRLFRKPADFARLQRIVATNACFAGRLQELANRAEAAAVADLPSLDRRWWETARTRPWAETYPQIFRHTWLDPYAWAKLARDCAYAGRLRPSAASRRKARDLLLTLADYSFEFEHYDVGMNYTVWGVVALEAYDLLYDEFTPAERRKLDAFFERFYRAVKKNDNYWIAHEPGGKLNNHYAWHKLCFVATGLFFHQPDRVAAAFDGPKGIRFLMRYGFTDDGLWREGAIPYQFAATTPLLQTAELLENAGASRSLYRETDGDGWNLRTAYDALLNLLFPDRCLPTVGDCYARRRPLGERNDYAILCRRFADPRYAWLLRHAPRRSETAWLYGPIELPPGTPPAPRSRLWPEAGYVALRSVEGADYWSGRGWTLFGTFSGNPVHSHADKLSIQLFGAGHLWLPDLEARASAVHAFSSPVQSALNRHTICHNTLLVDDRNQRHPGRRLDLLEYHVLPAVRQVTMGDLQGRLYAGVKQLRTCIVGDDYVLDVFQVAADQPRRWAWLTHVDGVPVRCSASAWTPTSFPDGAPWRYLVAPRKANVSERYAETFRHGDRFFRWDLRVSAPGELVQCGFPRDDGAHPKTTPMRLVRVSTQTAWFAAVYQCGPAPPPLARVSLTPGELGYWAATVQLGDRRFRHRVPQLADALR